MSGNEDRRNNKVGKKTSKASRHRAKVEESAQCRGEVETYTALLLTDFSSGMMMMLAEDEKDVDTTSTTAEVLRRCSNGLVLYVLRGTLH